MSDTLTVSPQTLIRMATRYLARHSASTAHLREILERKIRRRCEACDLPVPDDDEIAGMIEAAVERLVDLDLVDDVAYARGKAKTLAAKGWPAWRIGAELDRRGIDPATQQDADLPDLDEAAQARRFAERKRLGPFRTGERDAHRDKDIRSLVRAGFSLPIARAIVDETG